MHVLSLNWNYGMCSARYWRAGASQPSRTSGSDFSGAAAAAHTIQQGEDVFSPDPMRKRPYKSCDKYARAYAPMRAFGSKLAWPRLSLSAQANLTLLLLCCVTSYQWISQRGLVIMVCKYVVSTTKASWMTISLCYHSTKWQRSQPMA